MASSSLCRFVLSSHKVQPFEHGVVKSQGNCWKNKKKKTPSGFSLVNDNIRSNSEKTTSRSHREQPTYGRDANSGTALYTLFKSDVSPRVTRLFSGTKYFPTFFWVAAPLKWSSQKRVPFELSGPNPFSSGSRAPGDLRHSMVRWSSTKLWSPPQCPAFRVRGPLVASLLCPLCCWRAVPPFWWCRPFPWLGLFR